MTILVIIYMNNRIITTMFGTFLFQIVSKNLHSFSCSGHILDYLPNVSGQFDDCIVLPTGNWYIIGDIQSAPESVVDKFDTMLGVYYKDYRIAKFKHVGRGMFSVTIPNTKPSCSTNFIRVEQSLDSVIDYDKLTETILFLKKYE